MRTTWQEGGPRTGDTICKKEKKKNHSITEKTREENVSASEVTPEEKGKRP